MADVAWGGVVLLSAIFALFHSGFSLCILFIGPVCLSLHLGQWLIHGWIAECWRRHNHCLRPGCSGMAAQCPWGVEESDEGGRGHESSAAISLAANGTRCSLLKLVTLMHTGLLLFVLYVNVMAFFFFFKFTAPTVLFLIGRFVFFPHHHFKHFFLKGRCVHLFEMAPPATTLSSLTAALWPHVMLKLCGDTLPTYLQYIPTYCLMPGLR